MNIVKETCQKLSLTQKELAEKIGAAEATVRNWSAGKDVPNWAVKSTELLIENHKNRKIITTLQTLQTLLKEI